MKHFKRLILVGLLGAAGLLRAETNTAAPATASVLESNVVCLRVSKVAAGLAAELAAAERALAVTNKIIGTVLDLRFAGEGEGKEVAAAADYIAAKRLPLAILVNARTHGAAAALALALRSRGAGLVFGGGSDGLHPDIEVPVKMDDEKVYFADAYAVVTNRVLLTETNAAARDTNRPAARVSEADLVRARRAGAADPEAEAEGTLPAAKPVVRDPVLARALDLLQGLAVVRRGRGD
ncbi:MAG: hypothetical protein NTZ16_05050 [Verrucomicrobia bacterium]|nr:hypothetical protein [Verrucomicrobiota bacterium]